MLTAFPFLYRRDKYNEQSKKSDFPHWPLYFMNVAKNISLYHFQFPIDILYIIILKESDNRLNR